MSYAQIARHLAVPFERMILHRGQPSRRLDGTRPRCAPALWWGEWEDYSGPISRSSRC